MHSSTRLRVSFLLIAFTALAPIACGHRSSGSGGKTSAASTSSATTSTGQGGNAPMGTRVRVAAANLSSGTAQSYDEGSGARILQGIHADVVLIQEFNEGANTAADIGAFVTRVCGAECVYARGASAGLPNGVISRYPITSSGSWADSLVSNRDFVWAEIAVPGPKHLWAISVHLLTTSASNRANEASEIVTQITASVPAGDYVVLGGDFNTQVRTEPALTAFDPLFDVAAPYPADQNGNSMTSAPRTRPYDWVLASDGLRANQTPVVIGTTTFPDGAVIDTRIYQPLSDVAPALATDSGAVNMQHMAVVKDFAL